MRLVTLRHIRSIIERKEKISIDRAVELIKADRSHHQYSRNTIKKVIKMGVLIQLTNHTLQMAGVGIDADPKNIKRKSEKEDSGGLCMCWTCVNDREQLKKNSKKH